MKASLWFQCPEHGLEPIQTIVGTGVMLLPAVVGQLADLVLNIATARRDIVRYAREAGELLLTVGPKERAAVAKAAGITGRRTRFVYVQVAQHWERVQHAASLREAIDIIKATRVSGRAIPLPYESRCVVTLHQQTGFCRDDG